MAFPPSFLDELRARVGLADLIGRRVKLTRKGREHSGLCPFHSEKTPSFTVSEDKGFFHCFGCGAHGDAIGYVMRTENLSFPEAVERLAAEAGLQVPVATPEERQREKRRATLLEATEAACTFYEESLRQPVGREGLAYLRGRGLDDETIARFRLGFAPEARGALKAALMGEAMPEPLLIEAGLLGRPEDGGATFERFRGRVTFPITDRRGRVIAFGARALGDQQPKYLNSPDTPLFQKGTVLYGMASASRAAGQSGRVIVAEGYMDVIALARAGMAEAVAPLGTALTEAQIALLWRMADEPILCFDGDNAGMRAAARAAERALPHLAPGKSLRFVSLPKGEDPDSLIRARGAAAMEDVLAGAMPLDRMVWQIETEGRQIDTPERLAGLESRLEARAFAIADKKVQYQYLAEFRRRLREFARPAPSRDQGGRRAGGPGGGWRRDWRPRRGYGGMDTAPVATGPRLAPEALPRRREQALMAAVINHPELLDSLAEALGTVSFSDPGVDKLRSETLLHYAASPDLEIEGLVRHLRQTGCSDVLTAVLGPEVTVHAAFARPEADTNLALRACIQIIDGLREPDVRAQLAEAQQAFARAGGDDDWASLKDDWESLEETIRAAQRQNLERAASGDE
jgi:DNA primase